MTRDEVIAILKEVLSVEVLVDKTDAGDDRITVTLYVGKDEISSDSDFLPEIAAE